MNDRIVLTEHIDVRIVNPESKRIEVFVADKPVVHCVHVACALPEDELRDVNSVNELIAGHRSTEHQRVTVDVNTLLQLHASNLQVWIEHGYDSALIDDRIARPILEALAWAGDDKAHVKYLESVLDRWQAGNYTSRHALILYNEPEIRELVNQGAIARGDYEAIAFERSFYMQHGGNGAIVDFVLNLERPQADSIPHFSLHHSIYQRIEDHGGFDALRDLYDKTVRESSEGALATWHDFLKSLRVIEGYRFKRSNYFDHDEPVFIKSKLVIAYKYIVLTRDGWRAVGTVHIPYKEWRRQTLLSFMKTEGKAN